MSKPHLDAGLHPLPAGAEKAIAAMASDCGLSPLEVALLTLLCRNAGDAAIGARLGLPAATVRRRVRGLLQKTAEEDRSTLVLKVWRGSTDSAWGPSPARRTPRSWLAVWRDA